MTILTPQDIQQAAALVRRLKKKVILDTAEHKLICSARLQVALWVCSVENILPERKSLAFILGQDADETLKGYVEPDKGKTIPAAMPKPFWDGAFSAPAAPDNQNDKRKPTATAS